MKLTDIGGTYQRVADPGWVDPLDTDHAMVDGGRWNASGSHATLYLNADHETARANVRLKFHGLPYGPEDLDPADAPHLVEVAVPAGRACDVRTDKGLTAVGLPVSYPLDATGAVVTWDHCQPVGASAHGDGLDGVACRSAAPGGNEELAWFPQPDNPTVAIVRRREFPDWYW